MSMNQHKRQMSEPVKPGSSDPYIASLATVGMRVRKAVAEGYNVPDRDRYDISGFSQNGMDYARNDVGQHTAEENNSTGFRVPQRVPLPAHMDGPPGLSDSLSTAESSSNLSDWEANYRERSIASHMQRLSPHAGAGGKRKFEDVEQHDGLGTQAPILNDYRAKYGNLRFDEDF
ncbi:Piso0_002615 [Millerozyma farinosa CBS 7064]|uniref:Damage-regulated import facilitator 1 n=1 Tax=Pichia sorbitophila (strain ATCC MYA-4447 / BCRC 22081 / CBS 7064 / NBRC 10061 / NRRL Y-12695) TaxID=559304 RepID=G8YD32_PICSO|nr:Piso0_002615 [Millerozyma farinosa CBS 7064]